MIKDMEKFADQFSLRSLLKIWLLSKLSKNKVKVIEVNDRTLLESLHKKNNEDTRKFVQSRIDEIKSKLENNALDKYASIDIEHNCNNEYVRLQIANQIINYFKKKGFSGKMTSNWHSTRGHSINIMIYF